MVADTRVYNPPVGVGVLDDPSVAIRDGVIWLLKRPSPDVGEGVLTLPLAARREPAAGYDGRVNPSRRLFTSKNALIVSILVEI